MCTFGGFDKEVDHTVLLTDGSVARVGQGAGLAVAEACSIVFIPAEVTGGGSRKEEKRERVVEEGKRGGGEKRWKGLVGSGTAICALLVRALFLCFFNCSVEKGLGEWLWHSPKRALLNVLDFVGAELLVDNLPDNYFFRVRGKNW